ncbi:MAG: homoserine dehydrogenase [Candidatus Nanopelagicales bacterium]|nr:homoserine dehydrogenase [Candidatus Nanopelagicales bacterium]
MSPAEPTRPVTVAVLGGGTVGTQVARLLNDSDTDLHIRMGTSLKLTKVAVRDLTKPRDIDASFLTDDAMAVATSGADIVVELIGGIEPAKSLILAAIAAGSSIVTANKALLASDGASLYAAAEAEGVDIFFEASVAGAIPLVRVLQESLAGDHITKVMGIVNGTTNYILTRMDEDGASFADALAEAQSLGYAEADPTADVEGHDAASKAAILAELAFHTHVTREDVYCEGITTISQVDIRAAKTMGCVIKLLAIAERKADDSGVIVRVHPTMVPKEHPLASVREAFNAIFVEAEAAGELMFYGRGAGGAPTASAVLGDVVVAARNRLTGSVGWGESADVQYPVLPISEALTCYYVNIDVIDRPGALASIAQAFSESGVSIQVVRQDGHGDRASLIVRTHRSTDGALQATVNRLRKLSTVKAVVGVMRVEGEAGA